MSEFIKSMYVAILVLCIKGKSVKKNVTRKRLDVNKWINVHKCLTSKVWLKGKKI